MEAQQPCAIRAQQPYVLGQARKELLPMIQARKNAIIRIQVPGIFLLSCSSLAPSFQLTMVVGADVYEKEAL